MTFSPLERLRLETMASGHLALELTERITWGEFPRYVADLLTLLGGEITDRTDTVEMRLWKCQLNGSDLRVVFEDYPCLVSLESISANGDEELHRAFRKLTLLSSTSTEATIVRLRCDWGAWPTWRYSEVAGNENIAPEALAISEAMKLSIECWDEWFQSSFVPDDPRESGFSRPQVQARFMEMGHRIAAQLSKELGDQWEVWLDSYIESPTEVVGAYKAGSRVR